MKKYFVFLLLIASCNGLSQSNNMIKNQANMDRSYSANHNPKSHTNGSVSVHKTTQDKIVDLCKKHVDKYFRSIREKKSDTKVDVSTLLEGILQLIVEDKASRDGIPINL
ncbi:hypothetical protein [Cardinium endosymbiont of Philonthus spinipes]|uniref:hypothetical protein n=1 Tax=Cardinium endosymbiont of Philonthus spinipes TaxID=3077941 RepID=UPI00313B4B6D